MCNAEQLIDAGEVVVDIAFRPVQSLADFARRQSLTAHDQLQNRPLVVTQLGQPCRAFVASVSVEPQAVVPNPAAWPEVNYNSYGQVKTEADIGAKPAVFAYSWRGVRGGTRSFRQRQT